MSVYSVIAISLHCNQIQFLFNICVLTFSIFSKKHSVYYHIVETITPSWDAVAHGKIRSVCFFGASEGFWGLLLPSTDFFPSSALQICNVQQCSYVVSSFTTGHHRALSSHEMYLNKMIRWLFMK